MDETILLQRARDGDERAFRTLYAEHTPGLFRFALRLTGGSDAESEEIVQETWVRAVRSLDRFEGRSNFRSWLNGIAARCAAEAARKSARFVPNESAVAAAPAPAHVEPAVDLERAVAALPAGFRTVLLLHDLEGYTHAEIADVLGISAGTSKSQLSRARARVRAALGGGS
ncbi:MAG: RNA polymerase sigma factor [Gemmatimonadota bacterium]